MEKQINEDYKRLRSIRRLKIFGVLAAVLAVLAVVFFLVFSMRKVVVNGNERYSDDEIRQALQAEGGRNAVFYYLEYRDVHEIPELLYVERVDISFGMPDTIYIDVVEKKLVGCIEKDGRYYYFDTEGTILEESGAMKAGVPLIRGAELQDPGAGDKIHIGDEKIYSNLLQLSLLFNKYEINADSVDFDKDGNIILYSGDIKTLLGDGTDLEDRIANYVNVMPALEGMKGTLDLTNYSSSDDTTIFRREE